jgi:hypothetical protein
VQPQPAILTKGADAFLLVIAVQPYIDITQSFKELNIHQSVHYYGPGDLATGWGTS